MNVIVRFNWQYDLDLIALSKHPDFPIGLWMKQAVVAYARGEGLVIPLPSPQPFPIDLNDGSTHFSLNEETESDVIQALQGLRTGHRNSAIKNIFRAYLEAPRLDPYYNDDTYRVKSRKRDKLKKSAKAIPRPSVKPRVLPKQSTAPSVHEQKKYEQTNEHSIVQNVSVPKNDKQDNMSVHSVETKDTSLSLHGKPTSDGGMFGAIESMIDESF